MKIIYNNVIPFKGYWAINLFGILFVRKDIKSTIEFLKDNSLCVDNFDSFILHQANLQIIKSIMMVEFLGKVQVEIIHFHLLKILKNY